MAGLDAKIEDGALKVQKKASASHLEQNMIKGLFGANDPIQ